MWQVPGVVVCHPFFLFNIFSFFASARMCPLFFREGGVGELEPVGCWMGWGVLLYLWRLQLQNRVLLSYSALACYDHKKYPQGDDSYGPETRLKGCKSIIHFLLDSISFTKAPNMIYCDICSFQPMEIYVDDEAKLTLHGLVQVCIQICIAVLQ